MSPTLTLLSICPWEFEVIETSRGSFHSKHKPPLLPILFTEKHPLNPSNMYNSAWFMFIFLDSLRKSSAGFFSVINGRSSRNVRWFPSPRTFQTIQLIVVGGVAMQPPPLYRSSLIFYVIALSLYCASDATFIFTWVNIFILYSHVCVWVGCDMYNIGDRL